MRRLIKVEGANPTRIVYDRGNDDGNFRCRRRGCEGRHLCVNGNTSASAAAYAVRAGMVGAVLVPDGKIAMGNQSALVHGAQLLQVEGNFDDCLTLARDPSELYPSRWSTASTPARIEGQKTAPFEIVDQLGRQPDIHCLPVRGTPKHHRPTGRAYVE